MADVVSGRLLRSPPCAALSAAALELDGVALSPGGKGIGLGDVAGLPDGVADAIAGQAGKVAGVVDAGVGLVD